MLKKTTMATLVILFSIAFSGCAEKKVCPKKAIPKLRTCVVKPKKVRYKIVKNRVLIPIKDYSILKHQEQRKSVCLDLLNRQNRDFNKKYTTRDNLKKEHKQWQHNQLNI